MRRRYRLRFPEIHHDIFLLASSFRYVVSLDSGIFKLTVLGNLIFAIWNEVKDSFPYEILGLTQARVLTKF